MSGRPGGAAADVVADAESFLRETLGDDIVPGDVRIVTVPAPAASPERLLRRRDQPVVFWSVPGGAVQVGLGAAADVRASGDDRFTNVRIQAAHLWDRLEVVDHPDTTPIQPRLLGGFSFLAGETSTEWRSFGDARFVLPRLLYARDAEGARLSVAVGGDREALQGAVEQAIAVLRELATPSDSRAAAEPRSGGQVQTPESEDARERWRHAVASIKERIGKGEVDKVVAARRKDVGAPSESDLPTLLGRLATESSTAARFAFRFAEGVFMGATPERLVGRQDVEVRTEALAGTVRAGSPERERRLLESFKDSVEHGYVVAAIAEALGPLCERLDYPSQPRVQRLRHVVHLQTPFVGRLRDPVHVLELVERLHPTPAVGGWPTAPALEWIRAEEPGTRGWYAAPVGWFDRNGDGEFGVALRSGLLGDAQAWLYAGAGIVADSDADAEFDETEVKLRTMLDALGLAG